MVIQMRKVSERGEKKKKKKKYMKETEESSNYKEEHYWTSSSVAGMGCALNFIILTPQYPRRDSKMEEEE